MEYQIPLRPLTSCFADVTNPDNELLGFFAQVDPEAVEAMCAPYYRTPQAPSASATPR